jgi:transcriptional regulator with XRE-family HTH domain
MTVSITEGLAPARTRAGVGQRELARRTGIAQTILSRIEAGERSVKANELASIAWALGCTVSELTRISPVRGRALCVARASEGSDMEGIRSELIHYLELDAYLEDQGIPQPQ